MVTTAGFCAVIEFMYKGVHVTFSISDTFSVDKILSDVGLHSNTNQTFTNNKPQIIKTVYIYKFIIY